MSNWEKTTIGNLCDSISDTYKRNDENVVLINTSDVLEGEVLNHKPVLNQKLKGQFKKTFRISDILYSEIRPANKRFAFIDFEDTSNYIASTKLMVLRPRTSIVLPEFLFAILKSKNVVDELQHLAETRSGTFPQITFSSELAPMEVFIPDISTQEQIVSILKAIEDKIKNNTAINENLEQQAQAIVKSWFVDFEPFGGIMPDDWETQVISDLDVLITDYVANGSFKSLAQNVKYQTQETNNVLIRLTDFNNNFSSDMVYISDSAYDFLGKSKLYGDEIIISNVGVNVGTVFRCPRLNKRMSLAPNSIMLRSKSLEHYLYLYFTSPYGQQQLQSIVTGSAQPKFNKTNFRSLKILVPDNKTLLDFNAIYEPVYEMIASNNNQQHHLVTLRDTLLPKLINGEIDVSEIRV